jgi:hypothetical protein
LFAANSKTPVISVAAETYFTLQNVVGNACCRIGCRKNQPQPKSFLKGMIDEAVGAGRSPWNEIEERHKQLLAQTRKKLFIKYSKKDESISVNGEHLIRGIPAIIFNKIITAFIRDGRTIFEQREFMKDDDIIVDPLNPNITVRIQRLEQRLLDRIPDIRISKLDRGKIKLEADCEVVYTEESL